MIRRRFHARRLLLVALATQTLLLVAAIGGAPAASERRDAPAVPGQLIVKFKEGVSEAERDDALAQVAAREEEELDEIEAEVVEVAPDDVDEAIKKLEQDPRVEYAEPNYLLFADAAPTDARYSELWGLNNTGQTVNGTTGAADADIDAPEAWNLSSGSATVVVGVIDSGVDFTHPDLAGARWTNPNEIQNGLDDDANGYIDDLHGWDFVNNDNNPQDDNNHGTHVAGTIGATANDGGVVGVNWNVRIAALKFLNAAGSGTTANAIKAIEYAANKGIPITNNSWGGGGFSQALLDAISNADAKNSLFVAAAGNDGVNADSTPHYPSSYDAPNIISVAATTQTDAKATFSNFGRKSVDLGAPGTNILSSTPGGTYQFFNGTSMATPHVAGVAALAKARFPGATDVGLKSLLLRTVDPNAALAGVTTTEGRLNANSTVSCAAAPKVWIEAPAPGFTTGTGQPVPVKVLGSSCGDPAGTTVTATGNGSPITLTARGDGYYSGTYTPTTGGAVTIEAKASVGLVTDTRTVSGNAAQNYRFENAPFAWIDATAGGTKTGLTADDGSVAVALPFGFTYYGEAFTSVKVASNGYLVFGTSAATQWLNSPLPNTAAPNGTVAPHWDDLSPNRGGSIWTRTTGVAPNRKFVVAWVGVPHFDAGGAVTFEVILEEGTNDIYFQYQDVVFGNASYDNGASATVGVENGPGTTAAQYSHNEALLAAGKAIRFTTQPDTPNTAPTAVAKTVTTAEDTPVTITLTGTDAETCELTFSAGAPANGTLGTISNSACAAGAPNADSATVTYTPKANFSGSDSFTYTVNDGRASATAAVTITVTAVNDPPTAANKTATTATGTAVTITLSAADPDNCELTFSIVAPPAAGSLGAIGNAACGAGSDTATVTYTPNGSFSGSDTFTYKANDGLADSNVATVTITVQAPVTVQPPTSLQANDGGDVAQLGWTASTTTGVSYAVERAPWNGSSCGTFQTVATGITITDYSDSVAADSYCYRVFATKNGASSAPSNVATVTVTGD